MNVAPVFACISARRKRQHLPAHYARQSVSPATNRLPLARQIRLSLKLPAGRHMLTDMYPPRARGEGNTGS